MASIQKHPLRRHRPSTPPRLSFTFLATISLLITFSLFLSTLMTPSHALPVTLKPRRNPLTIGLGLRGGGLGLSLGGNGNSLFNFHQRPRNLRTRASIEQPSPSPETQAAEKNEAIVSSLLQKRSAFSGPPASGAEADSDSGSTGGGGGRPLGSPRRGQYHILPIQPSEVRPMGGGSGEEEGEVVRRSVMLENRKRQHVPGNPPGSGSNFNKNDPFSRRSEE